MADILTATPLSATPRGNGRSNKNFDEVLKRVTARESGDPAQNTPGAPPNFGKDVFPHVLTFQGILSSIARVYRPSDEALRDSHANARFMRNDCSIMECLEQRKRSTALLDWHLEPEDAKSPAAQWVADQLTAILLRTRRFMQYRDSLLEALWYGRSAVRHRYEWQIVDKRSRVCIADWQPVHGDKMVFRYDDGTGTDAAENVGIRVGAGYAAQHPALKKWADITKSEKIKPTDWGLAYFLDPWEREMLAIHKHQIEDGEYEDPENAGRIHGIGIRSRIYWTFFQKQEALAWLMEYLERSGFGIELWYYPAGNPKARDETRTAAEERIGQGRNIILVPRPAGDEAMNYGVDRIEPGMAGAGMLKDILAEYFGHQIKRYILGQTLTTEASNTGLGSNLGEIHLATYMDIIKYDATNLQETLTTELVDVLKMYNFPAYRDVRVLFKIHTESENIEQRLTAWRNAYDMGAKLKARDIYDMIGATEPGPEDEVLQSPQFTEQSEGGMGGEMGGGGMGGGDMGGGGTDPPRGPSPAGPQQGPNVGALRTVRGTTYRMNNNHRWERYEKDDDPERYALKSSTGQMSMFDEEKHPRSGKGSSEGGQFTSGGGGGGSAGDVTLPTDAPDAQLTAYEKYLELMKDNDSKPRSFEDWKENLFDKVQGAKEKPEEQLPERTADTMSDAIAQSSPSGSTSKRAKEAAQKKLSEDLFGKGGLAKPKAEQASERDHLLKKAKELRTFAERGLRPQANVKEAERLEAQAAALGKPASVEHLAATVESGLHEPSSREKYRIFGGQTGPWEEGKHPRGQAENPGQFSESSGGGQAAQPQQAQQRPAQAGPKSHAVRFRGKPFQVTQHGSDWYYRAQGDQTAVWTKANQKTAQALDKAIGGKQAHPRQPRSQQPKPLDVEADSDNPLINAVALGQGKYLGKGQEGLVFAVANRAIKVSKSGGSDKIAQEAAVGEQMRKARVPGILKTQLVKHGGRDFAIRDELMIMEQLDAPQLEEARQSIVGMHAKGFSLNDRVQVGLDQYGRVMHYDVGKAAPLPDNAEDRKTRIAADEQALWALYRQSDQQMVPFSQMAERKPVMPTTVKGTTRPTEKEKPSERRRREPRLSRAEAIGPVAEEWGVNPDHLSAMTDDIHAEMGEFLRERETAKRAARDLTGLSAKDIAYMENQGYDHAGAHKLTVRAGQKMKSFDTFAQEIARQHPGILGDPDDPQADFAAGLWDLIREGKQDMPSQHDPQIIKEAAKRLHEMGATPEPAREEEEERVPFSRAGLVEKYRLWSVHRKC